MSVEVGMVVKSWATDALEEYQTGVVIRIKETPPEIQPRFIEILWDDGTIAGEFEDELEIILLEDKK